MKSHSTNDMVLDESSFIFVFNVTLQIIAFRSEIHSSAISFTDHWNSHTNQFYKRNKVKFCSHPIHKHIHTDTHSHNQNNQLRFEWRRAKDSYKTKPKLKVRHRWKIKKKCLEKNFGILFGFNSQFFYVWLLISCFQFHFLIPCLTFNHLTTFANLYHLIVSVWIVTNIISNLIFVVFVLFVNMCAMARKTNVPKWLFCFLSHTHLFSNWLSCFVFAIFLIWLLFCSVCFCWFWQCCSFRFFSLSLSLYLFVNLFSGGLCIM